MMACARGFLTLDDLLELPSLAAQWRAIETRHPAAPRDRLLRELVRGQIGVMVNDVLGETRARIAGNGVASVADVRAAGRALCGFSPEMQDQERVLKRFMYDRLYLHPVQVTTADAAREVIASLYAAYAADPALLPASWQARLGEDTTGRARTIADYIAGDDRPVRDRPVHPGDRMRA